jgi:hypothetical protein
VLGPIVSLLSSTGGALLSMEDNVTMRRNTLSGLRYAVEYCLKATFIGGSASSYSHYYGYANDDTVEYVQNASVPNNDNDNDNNNAVAADGGGGGGDEYIAVLVSGGRIYMKEENGSVLLPPSADEVMNVVTSAITGNENNGNDLPSLSSLLLSSSSPGFVDSLKEDTS